MNTTLHSYTLSFRQDHEETIRTLTAGRDFRFNLAGLCDYFTQVPAARLTDLLRIGVASYVIDRLAKRGQQARNKRWARTLIATVEVQEPDFWNQDVMRQAVVDCLDFVGGDNWQFSFLPEREANRGSGDRRYIHFPEPGETPVVSLASGGLDSTSGLCSLAHDHARRALIPVTVWHQPRQRKLLKEQYRLVRDRYGVWIHPLILKTALVRPDWKKEEKSQRCRSFLFSAVGGVAAALCGAATVEVLESGVGAVNLPLMAGMVGSKATRGCHPEFLRRMTRLVSLVSGRPVVYRLPFLQCPRTKAEMVKRLADDGLRELALQTVSCVHYPLRHKRHKQCGVCAACVFRRQAMLGAGIQEPADTYLYDLFGPAHRVNRIPAHRLRYLKAFLLQVAQLDGVGPGHEVPRRFRRHLYGTGVLRVGDDATPVIELLSRYRQEWLAIVARAQVQGWSWANLLAPPNSLSREGGRHASA